VLFDEQWSDTALMPNVVSVNRVLTRFRDLARRGIMRLRVAWLRQIWGFRLDPTVRVSFGAFLDRSDPSLIEIGAMTIITRGTVILSHDRSRGVKKQVVIGRNSFVGVNSVIMPGVSIGDECVIGAGSIVLRDVPSNCLAAGNPARPLKRIHTGPYGRIIEILDIRDGTTANMVKG
jgi:acetyltransferase-like isoleucine patch superfamily enzyme